MKKYSFLYLVPAIIFCPFLFTLAFADNTPTDPAAQISPDKNWEFSQSIKYSRGKYGTSLESETYEADSVLQRDFANADISLTIPSLWQTGNITATSNGRVIINKRAVRTTSNTTISPTISGLGDITFNGNYYLFQENRNAPLDVALTSYIKAPTASSRKGLGTGEWDGGPGVGFTKKIIDNIKAFADASFVFDGKVKGQNTEDQYNLDGGLQYDITSRAAAAVKYEYSSPSAKGAAQAEDIAISLDYNINDDWRINGEVALGLTNGSPDESYLLGATVRFEGGLLGGLFSSNPSSTLADYQAATTLFEPINDRIISDPLYMPLKSQFYGSTAYSYGLSRSSNYNYKGIKTANSSTDANAFVQTLLYGVTDKLALRLSDSYQFAKAFRALSSTGATTTNNNDGFNNPVIGTSFRAVDQSSFPADIDLTLNISPNSFKAKEAGGGHDGTQASGNQPVTFTTAIGREMKALTISGVFTAAYAGNRYYESLANNDNYYEHEYFNYTFALNTQTRFTDRLSLNLGTGYTITDKAYATNLTTGAKFIATLGNTLDFNAAINYHIIPNKLVGALTYTYDDFSNSKSTYQAAASDTSSKNHYANIFGARLQYLF